MGTNVVVGLQWGDEGKGKIIDILAQDAAVVVRSQGGNNAGHTVQAGEEVYKLHLIPSGILYEGVRCYIGAGVVVDPKVLLEEIAQLQDRGISCENLWIDPRAHVIMPWHIERDILMEKWRGDADLGTTRRGIGPCYMDKVERTGIRMCDLCEPDRLEKKVYEVGTLKNDINVKVFGGEELSLETVFSDYKEYGQLLKPRLADASVASFDAVQKNENVLFEGAQATLLDIDMGTYPYVTSSHPITGGVCVGVGIGPNAIEEVVGVGKAYITRVGKGPFPTELLDDIGDLLREKGHEYGTTTGRPRRTGWFDAVLVRHGVRVNGLTQLAINKLDTLSGLEELKVCVAYQKPDGTITKNFPPTLEELEDCLPIYETLPGFEGDLSQCKTFDELPQTCKEYLAFIEAECGCPVTMIGVGPSRCDLIRKK